MRIVSLWETWKELLACRLMLEDWNPYGTHINMARSLKTTRLSLINGSLNNLKQKGTTGKMEVILQNIENRTVNMNSN